MPLPIYKILDRSLSTLNFGITSVNLRRNIIPAFIAICLIGGTVYLGFQSVKDNRFVIWFGLASAIAAPVGLNLFTYAFRRSDREIIQQLAKVPEIERLIEQAKTQEEKIQVLEAERSRLAEIVKIESRRQAALDRINSLEGDAVRILAELENLDRELILIDEQVGGSAISEEIRRLRERIKAREDGDVILRIGSRVYRIDRDIIKALPFGLGNPLIAYFLIAEKLQKAVQPKQRR